MAALSSGVDLALIAMCGLTPKLISIVTANILIILAMLLVYRGLAIFYGV
ncbi:hypothetical protein DFAR_710009 [Desulfarculales bacterium]